MSAADKADVRLVVRRILAVVSRFPAARARRVLDRALPLLVLGPALAGSIAIAQYYARDYWFVGDDWDFLLHRGTVEGADVGPWAPHYGHWSTGVVVVYRFLFSVVGIESYLPYVAVCWVLHVGIVATTYLLLRRAGAGRPVSMVVGWVLAFLGAGAEALLWDAVMNLLASLFFMQLALLVYLVGGHSARTRMAAWLLLVAGLMFSGAGITGVVVVATFLSVRESFRIAVEVSSVPVIAYAAWWLLAGRTDTASTVEDPVDYLGVPEFFWNGLIHPFDALTGSTALGAPLLLLLLVLPVIAHQVPEPLRALAGAGVVGAVFQMLITSLTRVSASGLDWAESGRYGYLTTVFLAPSFALGLSWLLRRRTGGRLVPVVLGAALLGLYTVQAAALIRAEGLDQGPYMSKWRERTSGLVAAVEDGERVLTDQMDPDLNPFLRATLVAAPEIRAAVRDEVTEKGRVDAENLAMVSVGPTDPGLPAPEDLVQVSGSGARASVEPGCIARDLPAGAFLELTPSASGSSVSLLSPASVVRTHVVRDGTESDARDWEVEPGSVVHVATTAKDAVLTVSFDQPGSFVICNR